MDVLSLAVLAVLSGLAFALVRGRVVAPDDKPVAGAQVYFQALAHSDQTILLTTDAAGEFAVEADRPPAGAEYVGRTAIVAPGLALGGGYVWDGENVFKLSPPSELAGRVVAPDGGPVSGATVKVFVVLVTPIKVILFPEVLADRFSARTDAEGGWCIGGLPPRGLAKVELDDPRFARQSLNAQLGPDALPAAPIVARPGAWLTGRVLYEDGRPAAGIPVRGEGPPMRLPGAVTGADGRYSIGSIPEGDYQVIASPSSSEFPAACHDRIAVTEGGTTEVPDLVLTTGGFVEGLVVEAETGEPVEGATISAGHLPMPGTVASTDDRGRYRLHVQAGRRIAITVSPPPSYLREPQTGVVKVAKGKTVTADFSIRKGLSVSGLAVDTEDRPAVAVMVALVPPGEDESHFGIGSVPAYADVAGRLSWQGVRPGRALVRAREEWEVVEPRAVDLPAESPIRVVLRRLPHRTLRIRVLSTAGQPIAGASVVIEHSSWVGRACALPSTPVLRVGLAPRPDGHRTNLQGLVERSGLRPGTTLRVSASAPDYLPADPVEVTVEEGADPSVEMVLVPLSRAIAGTVLDAEGSPAPGAVVACPDGGPRAHAVTDEAGLFTLGNLPEAEARVFAASGTAFGRTTAAPGAAALRVVVSPRSQPFPGDVARGVAILKQACKDASRFPAGHRTGLTIYGLGPLDPDAALAMLAEAAEDEPGQTVGAIIYALAERDPARAAVWAPDKLSLLQGSRLRSYTVARLGLEVADLDPSLAADLYEKAKDSLPSAAPVKCGPDVRAVTLWAMASLAARLGLAEAGSLADQAIRETADCCTAGEESSCSEVWTTAAEHVAMGSAEVLEQVLTRVPEDEWGQAVGAAIRQLVTWNVPAARRLLAVLADPTHPNGEDGFYFDVSARAVITALGADDPAEAVRLARQVRTRDVRAAALAKAAGFQGKEEAACLFREAFDLVPSDNPGGKAAIAALAYGKDPELGLKLLSELRASLGDRVWDGGVFLPAFAFYYSLVDPAESRMMVEMEFTRRRRQPDFDRPGRTVLSPILAMAAIDLDRALEMADELPPDAWEGIEAKRRIAKYVCASALERRAMYAAAWDVGALPGRFDSCCG